MTVCWMSLNNLQGKKYKLVSAAVVKPYRSSPEKINIVKSFTSNLADYKDKVLSVKTPKQLFCLKSFIINFTYLLTCSAKQKEKKLVSLWFVYSIRLF